MFDPYHKWLGIPKDQRPPTYYQLLGISPDESDPDVIDEAAIRQTTYLRSYQNGPHGELCAKILGEIAKAKKTLLDAKKRKDYDATLPKSGSKKENAEALITEDELAKRSFQQLGGEAESGAPSIKRRQNPPSSSFPLIPVIAGGGIISVALMAVVGFLLVGRSPEPVNPGNDHAENVEKKGKLEVVDPKEKVVRPNGEVAPKADPVAGPEPLVQPENVAGPVANLDSITVHLQAIAAEDLHGFPGDNLAMSMDGRQIVYTSNQRMADFFVRETEKSGVEVKTRNKAHHFPYFFTTNSAYFLVGWTFPLQEAGRFGTGYQFLSRDMSEQKGLYMGLNAMHLAYARTPDNRRVALAGSKRDPGTPSETCHRLVIADQDTWQIHREWDLEGIPNVKAMAFASSDRVLLFEGGAKPRMWEFHATTGEKKVLPTPFLPNVDKACFDFMGSNLTYTTDPNGPFSGLIHRCVADNVTRFPAMQVPADYLPAAFHSTSGNLVVALKPRPGREKDVGSKCPLLVYSLGNGTPLMRSEDTGTVVRSLISNLNVNRIAGIGEDGKIRLWRMRGSELPMTVVKNPPVDENRIDFKRNFVRIFPTDSPTKWITALPPNFHFVESGDEPKIQQFAHRFPPKATVSMAVALLPEAKRCVANMFGNDRTLYQYDLVTGKLSGQATTENDITHLIPSSDEKYIAATSFNPERTVTVFDATTLKKVSQFSAQATMRLDLVQFHPDGKRILVPTNPLSIAVVDAEKGTEISRVALPGEFIRGWGLIPGSEKYLATASRSGEIMEIDANTLQAKVLTGNSVGPGQQLRIAPNGRFFAVLLNNMRTLVLYSYPEFKELKRIDAEGNSFCDHQFSPNSEFLVLGQHNQPMAQKIALPAPTEMVAKGEPGKEKKATVERVDAPDETKVKEIQKAILEQFGKSYAAAKKAVPAREKLVEELRKVAADSKDDPDTRYVLLSEAKDWSVQTYKVAPTLEILEEITGLYKVEPMPARLELFSSFAKAPGLSKESAEEVTLLSLSDANESAQADQFELAMQFVSVAESAAKKAIKVSLGNQVKTQEKELKAWAKEFLEFDAAQKSLVAKPDDVKARFVVGRYLFARKNEPDQAIPHLAKGGNDPLSEVARAEIAKPSDAKAMQKLADDWLNLGAKDSPALKSASQSRALFWLKQAHAASTGLAQVQLTSAVKKLEDQMAASTVNLESVGQVRSFRGHTGTVTGLQILALGKRLVSSGLDGTVRVWDYTTGKSLFGHNQGSPVLSGHINNDGSRLAVVTATRNLTLYNLRTPVPKKMYSRTDESPGGYFASGPHLIHVGSNGVRISGSDTSGGIIYSGYGPVKRLILNHADPDHSVLVGSDAVAITYEESGVLNRKRIGISGEVLTGGFSADGKFFAAATKEKIHLFEVPNFRELKAVDYKGGVIRAIAVLSGGDRVLLGGDDKIVRVYDLATGKDGPKYTNHTGTITALALSPDGRHAFSASTDGSIRQWKLPREKR